MASDVKLNIGKKTSHILPVGVDVGLFTPPATRSNAAPVVLFAGTVIERKGPRLMLEAAARFPQATFRIVGAAREGYDEVLRHRIAVAGLTNVKLDGPKKSIRISPDHAQRRYIYAAVAAGGDTKGDT